MFCVVTETSAGVQKILNKSLPVHAILQQAVQCSIHEVLMQKNSNFLDFSKLELVTEAPSSFSFLYHRKFLYGLQLANLSTLSVTKNLELIVCINSKTPIRVKIAEESCRLTCREADTDWKHPPPSKQTIKSSARALTLKLWNDGLNSSPVGCSTKKFFPSVTSAALIANQHLSYELSQILIGNSFLNVHQHRLKIFKLPEMRM